MVLRLPFVFALLLAGCPPSSVDREGAIDGECSAGSDNDGDGVTDCDDEGCAWDDGSAGLSGPVAGTFEGQTGSNLLANDCNDALDPFNQPAIVQQWDPIAGSATLTVDSVIGEQFPSGPLTFDGSVSLSGVVLELDGSPGVTCAVPDSMWTGLYLGWLGG